MFTKVLIANRGAIACRIVRTLKRLGIRSVAVYSDADRYSRHVQLADEAIHVGGAAAAESYLRQDRIIDAALATGAQAIHPGYGFLSENANFAEKCEAAGIAFVGPTPAQMRDFGLKHTARAIAQAHDVPLLPGSGLLDSDAAAVTAAHSIGYPVMLKSTAGGGGIGMQLCRSDVELGDAFQSVERLARNNFSQGGVFLEKFVERARHIEVQIFGDGRGNVVALGERDCSVQRRNQKVIEETPAPRLDATLRSRLLDCAQRLGAAVSYRSAGTVEFVYDDSAHKFYFLEVNTRLQVEHGVTEEVTGIDLVEWMLRVAANEPPDLANLREAHGHAIQVRLYAEDPAHTFRPSSGVLSNVELPEDVRVDHWIESGTEVSAYYDPMLAKIIAVGETRDDALRKLDAALARTRIDGIETNLAYLRSVIADAVFREGRQVTRYLSEFEYRPTTIEVLQPGTHSTVQDFPGRVGYWDIGVPPSGPMDDLAFRWANRLVGNDAAAAGLELTVSGPTLRFNAATTIAITGADMRAELDGVVVPLSKAVEVRAGAVLKLRLIRGAGQRTYLAIRGGLDVPLYMHSRATFTLGQFGGHAGRTLRAGDTLRMNAVTDAAIDPELAAPELSYTNEWTIAVTYGPHGAPDFFTPEDIDRFFAARWRVHYNSSRTGVRLIGPKPTWARSDGGEAGLHPSNIHDNAYAIGAIDFTGDMPIILGPDGPSLGGFVCPATIVRAELWKVGQLRPGDEVMLRRVSVTEAEQMERAQEDALRGSTQLDPLAVGQAVDLLSRPSSQGGGTVRGWAEPILYNDATSSPAVCYRQSGDKNLLIEYGPQVLDLELRFRVHALMQSLQQQHIDGLFELTPGIRSLQIHFDNRIIPQHRLLRLLLDTEHALPAIDAMEVPSRIVHLPLSWDDPATRLAIDKYMQSVRPDAPWCPSNIEFIRRINGLDSVEDVRRIVFDASYLVMGLGDVYLGAPVATPLDPRHRLVTTKYNPARTWTPENAVGIGGAYLCVYGMEGPGGYQFVGRTVQMWNRHRQTAEGTEGKPWLLRFFDQIRFFPVSADELLQLRADFPHGRVGLRIEPTTLRLRDYRRFLSDNRDSIDRFKARQQEAFEAERERWRVSGQLTFESAEAEQITAPAEAIPEGTEAALAPVTGSVWQLSVAPGQHVSAGDELLVIEAMKMEIPILAETSGEVIDIRCAKGKSITAGDILVVMKVH